MKALADELNINETNEALAQVKGLGFDLGGLGSTKRRAVTEATIPAELKAGAATEDEPTVPAEFQEGDEPAEDEVTEGEDDPVEESLYRHVGGGQRVLDTTLRVEETNAMLESIQAQGVRLHNRTIAEGKRLALTGKSLVETVLGEARHEALTVAGEILDKGVDHPIFKRLESSIAELHKALKETQQQRAGLHRVGAGNTEDDTIVRANVLPALRDLADEASALARQLEQRLAD